MFARLRRALTISATGRLLAIELAEEHGPAALPIIASELARHDLENGERAALVKARDILLKIYGAE